MIFNQNWNGAANELVCIVKLKYRASAMLSTPGKWGEFQIVDDEDEWFWVGMQPIKTDLSGGRVEAYTKIRVNLYLGRTPLPERAEDGTIVVIGDCPAFAFRRDSSYESGFWVLTYNGKDVVGAVDVEFTDEEWENPALLSWKSLLYDSESMESEPDEIWEK